MRLSAFAICLVIGTRAARAQDVSRPPHVRPESADLRRLIADAADQSVTFRSLLNTIDRSDVIVYVRARLFPTETLEGRIGLLSAPGQTRFLVIELACPRLRHAHMATLAHELQHAIEIAAVPWVTSAPTLATYYRQIGTPMNADSQSATFETAAARLIGQRVLAELQVATR